MPPVDQLARTWSWSGDRRICRASGTRSSTTCSRRRRTSVLLTELVGLPATWPRRARGEPSTSATRPCGGGAHAAPGGRAVTVEDTGFAVQVRRAQIERAIATLVDNRGEVQPAGQRPRTGRRRRGYVRDRGPRRRREDLRASSTGLPGRADAHRPAPGSGCRSSTRSCAATAGRCSPGTGPTRTRRRSRSPVVRKLIALSAFSTAAQGQETHQLTQWHEQGDF